MDTALRMVKTQDALVLDSVPEKAKHPIIADGIEEALGVLALSESGYTTTRRPGLGSSAFTSYGHLAASLAANMFAPR